MASKIVLPQIPDKSLSIYTEIRLNYCLKISMCAISFDPKSIRLSSTKCESSVAISLKRKLLLYFCV